MRNDIRQGVFENMKDHVKPNYAVLGRQYNADYRTVKKAFEEAQSGQLKTTKIIKKPQLLEPLKAVINDKLELNCSAMVIFKFIQKNGYLGSYWKRRSEKTTKARFAGPCKSYLIGPLESLSFGPLFSL